MDMKKHELALCNFEMHLSKEVQVLLTYMTTPKSESRWKSQKREKREERKSVRTKLKQVIVKSQDVK